MFSRVESARHRRLVEELASLRESERVAIAREADEQAKHAENVPANRPTMPWSSLRSVIGIMRGETADAVEDTERLY